MEISEQEIKDRLKAGDDELAELNRERNKPRAPLLQIPDQPQEGE